MKDELLHLIETVAKTDHTYLHSSGTARKAFLEGFICAYERVQRILENERYEVESKLSQTKEKLDCAKEDLNNMATKIGDIIRRYT